MLRSKGVFGKTGNIWILWLFECLNNICDACACLTTIWYNLELMCTNKYAGRQHYGCCQIFMNMAFVTKYK